jgi:hypothetical protein
MPVDFDALVNDTCVRTFGVGAKGEGLARYTPLQGAPFDIDGIFDEAWASVQLTTGRVQVPVSTTAPRFGARRRALPDGFDPAQGDGLQLPGGRSFQVQDVQPDGFEYVYLILTEV